jgi:hypothetical protein
MQGFYKVVIPRAEYGSRAIDWNHRIPSEIPDYCDNSRNRTINDNLVPSELVWNILLLIPTALHDPIRFGLIWYLGHD